MVLAFVAKIVIAIAIGLAFILTIFSSLYMWLGQSLGLNNE